MSLIKRIIVIGGVAGGASAAARARRLSEDAEIIIFEKGNHVSFANCGLPYHIGGEIADRERLLLLSPEKMQQSRRIDARINTEVQKIDRKNKTVHVYNWKEKRHYEEKYTDLILSPGAHAFLPKLPGVDSSKIFTLRDIQDMDKIVREVEKQKKEKVVVIGGGFIGLEVVEALVNKGKKVSLVEREEAVLNPIDPEMASSLHQELKMRAVNLHLGQTVSGFKDKFKGIQVNLENGDKIKCDFVVMAIGIKPESTLAKNAGLNIGEHGGILVDEYMCTNDPHIYAVGDAVEVNDFISGHSKLVPLAGPANRQGRIAADNIFGKQNKYRNTQGTAICKVFNLTVGVTGLNEKSLKEHNTSYGKIYLHPMSHASYYNGATPISIKVIFNEDTGKLIGAQAVGQNGVDKRIDVFAVAIRAGMTVYDLEHLELSYAPPYGSAKDPINYSGSIAANVLRGESNICHVEDIKGDELLIDVRLEAEVHSGTIEGALHIPLEELRDRLEELPKSKKLIVFCKEGLRAYQASLLLNQLQYDVSNLSGGYKTYCMYHDDGSESEAVSTESTGQSSDFNIVSEIDASGLSCPGPIQKLNLGIRSIKEGQAIRILSTDPGFTKDVPTWCRNTGHRLVKMEPANGSYNAVVIKV